MDTSPLLANAENRGESKMRHDTKTIKFMKLPELTCLSSVKLMLIQGLSEAFTGYSLVYRLCVGLSPVEFD